ncbi:tRNA pseudouridine(55) synthase TruB [Pelagerythrobacter marensis]|uniref:tRNA pseudouridine synthase B n=1 Tax=Pelagerythrobacter marensis TaxID=543877 RepID=A0ABZ2CZP2_9SPHN
MQGADIPHGWLILDKPRGLGSTQAVGAVKRNLREGGYPKTKVGHGGTLDPLAEGVLPIALGEATKLAGRMLDASKVYEFTIAFGEETDTLDVEGEAIARSGHRPARDEIAAVLPQFTGEIEQTPPAYSAVKIDGRRAYDRARAGEAVEMKVRRVTIRDLQMGAAEGGGGGIARHSPSDGPDGPPPPPKGEELEDVTLLAHVSKGTYIRSLARDIARALGTVGHVTYLRRVKAGPFALEQAISLDMLNEIGKGARLEDLLLPLEAGLDGIPAHDLDPESAQAVRQGRVLSGMPHPDGLLLAKSGGVPVALMEVAAGTAKVVRGFNIPDTAE